MLEGYFEVEETLLYYLVLIIGKLGGWIGFLNLAMIKGMSSLSFIGYSNC